MAFVALAVLSGSLAVAPPMRVDFQLDLPPLPISADLSPAGSGETDDTKSRPKKLLVSRTRIVVARGFGKDVPLEFAVRQIVPASVHVDYSDAVDRTLRVSWEGGRPWFIVLRAMAAPENLHVVYAGNEVRIAP